MVAIACPCPPLADGGRRHESDEVTLRERLGFVEASAVRNGISLRRAEMDVEDLETAEILAVLTEGYILYGVSSWTLQDEAGKPLPVNRATIREHLLSNWEVASVLADAADEVYGPAVMLPLLVRASTSSRPSPTEESTSASRPSGMPARKPSKPSSISTIPTADTATITSSPDGDSRSSPSSSSAA